MSFYVAGCSAKWISSGSSKTIKLTCKMVKKRGQAYFQRRFCNVDCQIFLYRIQKNPANDYTGFYRMIVNLKQDLE